MIKVAINRDFFACRDLVITPKIVVFPLNKEGLNSEQEPASLLARKYRPELAATGGDVLGETREFFADEINWVGVVCYSLDTMPFWDDAHRYIYKQLLCLPDQEIAVWLPSRRRFDNPEAFDKLVRGLENSGKSVILYTS